MPVALILDVAANATANPPQLASAAPAAAAGNSTALAGVVPWIQNFATGFATNMSVVTLTMDNAAIDIAKAAVVFLIIAGVLLWFSRVNKRLGKDLLSGGIIIGLFIEFAVPVLMSIHY
jgi:hypothetical protein